MYTEKMRASHLRFGVGRRNYELIAHVLRYEQPRGRKGVVWLAWRDLVEAFAEECRHHVGFDRGRFLRACGVKT